MRFINPVMAPYQSKFIGTVLVSILIMTIAANWVGIVIYGLITFYKSRAVKTKKKKQTKVFEKIWTMRSMSDSKIQTFSKVE